MRRIALVAAAAALLALGAAPVFADKKSLPSVGLDFDVPADWEVNDFSAGGTVTFVTGPKEGSFAAIVEDASAASFDEAVKSFKQIVGKTIESIESFDRADEPAKLGGMRCAVASGKATVEKKPRGFRAILLEAKKPVLVTFMGDADKWAGSQKAIDEFLASFRKAK